MNNLFCIQNEFKLINRTYWKINLISNWFCLILSYFLIYYSFFDSNFNITWFKYYIIVKNTICLESQKSRYFICWTYFFFNKFARFILKFLIEITNFNRIQLFRYFNNLLTWLSITIIIKHYIQKLHFLNKCLFLEKKISTIFNVLFQLIICFSIIIIVLIFLIWCS